MPSRPKVLIIDDDPEIGRMIQETLSTVGYEVFVASGGQEGLDLARRQMLDLIICDILMPGKDGLETIMDLRRAHPSAMIMAISGGGAYHMTSALGWAERVGAQASMRKPFTPEELVAKVRELLPQRS